jgi:hypothetical protein
MGMWLLVVNRQVTQHLLISTCSNNIHLRYDFYKLDVIILLVLYEKFFLLIKKNFHFEARCIIQNKKIVP